MATQVDKKRRAPVTYTSVVDRKARGPGIGCMKQPLRPPPPKPCPVCHVAMQATVNEADIVHRCQRCGLTVTFKATEPATARRARLRRAH